MNQYLISYVTLAVIVLVATCYLMIDIRDARSHKKDRP